ncbi:MAG TPA: cobyrinate a,c-diamide synthase [Petrotogaceae bacterium]|nr:cobyrinate a,c-diamide synthase [Petrotogaceae bacterium]HQF32120.1 cobyrinate a,c-diamide synthase [Petrotogaceae bacterium]HQH32190.1 cobyrinate a,c-diamide synthase [Petrotogaceae bacterium]HQI79383.1 cobyrinate a,c-diamide synthase [Petrotogaceae bacterium]
MQKVFFVTSLFTSSGKTLFTLGLLNSLKESVVSFKTGPDFIDPLFHKKITGKKGYNLDSFFLDGPELKKHFLTAAAGYPNIVIEGAMGVLDGIKKGYASCDDVADQLGLPVILLIESYPSIHTMGAVIKGVMSSMKSSVSAVIITKSKSQKLFDLQKEDILNSTGIEKIFRFPYDEALTVKSRHLGLDTSCNEIVKIAESSARIIKENMDLSCLCTEIPELPQTILPESTCKKTVAIASDEAFLFLYRENIEFFQKCGYRPVFFSPIKDSIPPDADMYYLPGGYPELYAKQLSANKPMLRSLYELCTSEKPVLAECGGFMYLGKSIQEYPMVGFFDVSSSMKPSMQGNFGYQNIKIKNSDHTYKGHEFHYAQMSYGEKPNALKITMESSKKTSVEGLLKQKTLGSFTHFYFRSSKKDDALWLYL